MPKSQYCVCALARWMSCVFWVKTFYVSANVFSLSVAQYSSCALFLALTYSHVLYSFRLLSSILIIYTPIPYWCAQLSVWEYRLRDNYAWATIHRIRGGEFECISPTFRTSKAHHRRSYGRNGREIASIYATIHLNFSMWIAKFQICFGYIWP